MCPSPIVSYSLCIIPVCPSPIVSHSLCIIPVCPVPLCPRPVWLGHNGTGLWLHTHTHTPSPWERTTNGLVLKGTGTHVPKGTAVSTEFMEWSQSLAMSRPSFLLHYADNDTAIPQGLSVKRRSAADGRDVILYLLHDWSVTVPPCPRPPNSSPQSWGLWQLGQQPRMNNTTEQFECSLQIYTCPVASLSVSVSVSLSQLRIKE